MTTSFVDDLELVVINDDEDPFVVDPNDYFEGDEPFIDYGSSLVAGGEDYDGGMIALVPTREEAERLAVENGLDVDDLHLTLCYLGPAAKITPATRMLLVEQLRAVARDVPVVDAEGFAVAAFNPTEPEKDTCLVLLVSGSELKPVRDEIDIIARTAMRYDYYPEQHEPWIPHVTLVYTNRTSDLPGIKDRTGPIRFDRLRLAFAGTYTDIPLYSDSVTADAVMDDPVSDPVTSFEKERDVNIKGGGGHNLRNHWIKGPGAAKIGWNTKGDFTRCVANLGDKVKNPKGLCAEYHKQATGKWPNEGKGKMALDDDCGCEEAIVADAAATETVVNEETGEWEGILVVEGVETGDGRKFSAGSLKWAEPPIPLQWAPANLGAHQGAVIAGSIDKVWRDSANAAMVRGRGRFDMGGENGREAFRLVKEGFLKGISIDPDSIADADVEMEFEPFDKDADPAVPQPLMQKPKLTTYHGGRIRAATLVSIPAFVEAQIALVSDTVAADAVTAATVHMTDITHDSWSAIDADLMLPDELPLSVAQAAFAYVGQSHRKKVGKYECRLLHHEINDDGTVGLANWNAVVTCMNYLASNRLSNLDKKRRRMAYDHLVTHYKSAGIEPPPLADDVQTDDLVACADIKTPPREWFDNPKLTTVTPFTVTDDGRIFGHAALWGACHTSFANSCVQPPYESDYSYFTTGEVVTADGTRVAAGQITLGTSHAATRGITAMQAIDHYGDTGTAVADVTAGADDHGIWIAGAVRPGVDHNNIHALRASALSGDWRRLGGSLRMVALLAVNVPGFPIPRTSTTMNGDRQLTLVAAGVVTEDAVNEARLEQMRAQVFGTRVSEMQSWVFSVDSLSSRVFADFNPVDYPRGPIGRFI